MQTDITEGFKELIETAHRLSADVAQTVEEILIVGTKEPLPPQEARSLLTQVVRTVRKDAADRGDKTGAARLGEDIESFTEKVMAVHSNLEPAPTDAPPVSENRLVLLSHSGVNPRPVKPSPIFHGRDVPVMEGFVDTRDIKIWDQNARIDIHLNQFRQARGRAPSAQELLDIMLGNSDLPGLENGDQFNIQELAKSIAVNGVRKPPVIDIDGTLLDGNRRVTACYLILNSSDFDASAKRRAGTIQVWQLTEHATSGDRESVIVSLNFEPDHKQDWPEYVKARKVYDHWQAMLAHEPQANPSGARQTEIRGEIARQFALSKDEVRRYIQMVELADDFEDHHVSGRKRDEYAVKHRTDKYFQYFDELGKGKGSGGVYWTLNQDDAFKHLVYDLLYDGKFQSWNKIRDLRYVYAHEDALDCLRGAREEPDQEAGLEKVNDACGIARAARAEQRQLGANTRIKAFVDWLKDLPVKSFKEGEPGAITQGNLQRLYEALLIVKEHLNAATRDGEA